MDIKNLIGLETICLDLKAQTKNGVLIELVDMLESAGKLNSKSQFLADIWKREAIGNTGFDDGIAIPHAKSSAVIKPTVAVGISRKGIDYGVEDDELSDVFFMLASPNGDDHHHIEVLAQISTKITEDGFVEKLKLAESKEDALEMLTDVQPGSETFQSNLTEFTSEPLGPWAQRFGRIKEHLLYGTSHMIPFIVAGGVLLSLSVMFSGHGGVPQDGVLADIAQMGIAGLTLFTVVLGGYIAFSIADKPGLAPGMIGSWIAVTHYNTGFLGAIVVGFFAGFIVWLLKKIQLPDNMSSLGSIFIYPLVGSFVTCGAVMWVIGEPIASAMTGMNDVLTGMAGSGRALLGMVLGAMTAFDMGGPINKVATLFAQTQINTQPWLMGGVGIAICTPPLGMALATFLAPGKFKRDEREAGKAAGIMGMIGISEGAIPFASGDPVRVLPAIVAGGVVGNVVGFMFHVINHAPWGGWIVLPVVEGKIGYIIGTIAGSVTTALIVIALKKTVTENDYYHGHSQVCTSVQGEGEADVLAVTSCPSGVAHTFLAAKSLEKAAGTLGIKIKIETQGANGVINRITEKDIEKAKFAILAHDVAIKDPERFKNMKVLDVRTRDAMLNASALLRAKKYK